MEWRLGRQFKTLTSYCHVINNTFWSLPLGHGPPTRPDTNLFRYFLFSLLAPSDCRKKCSCDKPPCLCSNGYALCVLRSIELKRERAILPVFANQFVDFALDLGRLISRAEPPVTSSSIPCSQ